MKLPVAFSLHPGQDHDRTTIGLPYVWFLHWVARFGKLTGTSREGMVNPVANEQPWGPKLPQARSYFASGRLKA